MLSGQRLSRSLRASVLRQSKKQQRHASSAKKSWTVSEEVADAVRSGKPVVALETAIYTHGFPYPDNIALSSSLEELVRANGAVPATMGILNGIAKVGMSRAEIEELLEKARDRKTVKVSRRDLALLCSSPDHNGGTTIAGGLVMAHLAGIKIFATGGLGGVHRDRPGETSMDISADLTELGRTPVALITSGCKSFLDIPRTLEVLETEGVGVSTFADGRPGPVDWPAFWTRESGIPSPNVVRDEKHAASIIHSQRNFPLSSGLLFANPIPAEYSISGADIDAITAQAVEDAAANGVGGSDNTPYILSRIKELSGGATIAANTALVEANVVRGAKVAVELSRLEASSRPNFSPQYSSTIHSSTESGSAVDVVVAGSAAVDLSCDYSPIVEGRNEIAMHTSNPASMRESLGGVACNIARACHYAGAKSFLCSIVGKDSAADSIRNTIQKLGMDPTGILDGGCDSRTARYVAVNDLDKGLVVAMADMGIIEADSADFNSTWLPSINDKTPKWLIVDANWSGKTLKSWIEAARSVGAKVAYEPVSVEKSTRLFVHERTLPNEISAQSDKHLQPDQVPTFSARVVDIVTPNALEVVAMSEMLPADDAWSKHLSKLAEPTLQSLVRPASKLDLSESFLAISRASLKLLSRIPCVLTKLGAQGVLQTECLDPTDPRLEDATLLDSIILCSDSVGQSLGVDASRIISQDLQGQLGGAGAILMRHHPALHISAENIESVNGVGDTFMGVLVAALATSRSVSMEEAISRAQKGAVLTLQSPDSASPSLVSLRPSMLSN